MWHNPSVVQFNHQLVTDTHFLLWFLRKIVLHSIDDCWHTMSRIKIRCCPIAHESLRHIMLSHLLLLIFHVLGASPDVIPALSGRKLKKFMRRWGFLNCIRLRAVSTLQRFVRRYSTDMCRKMKVRRHIDVGHRCFACSLTPEIVFYLLTGSEGA
jgi:hypothetical protein